MKNIKVEIIVDDNVSFRDIERVLNELNAETKLIEIEECE